MRIILSYTKHGAVITVVDTHVAYAERNATERPEYNWLSQVFTGEDHKAAKEGKEIEKDITPKA